MELTTWEDWPSGRVSQRQLSNWEPCPHRLWRVLSDDSRARWTNDPQCLCFGRAARLGFVTQVLNTEWDLNPLCVCTKGRLFCCSRSPPNFFTGRSKVSTMSNCNSLPPITLGWASRFASVTEGDRRLQKFQRESQDGRFRAPRAP